MGRHNDIDHKDMVVKYFTGAECDTDHCLVVAQVRETLSVHKHSAPKFVVEQCSMKKLIEGNVREDYQLKITNSLQLWRTQKMTVGHGKILETAKDGKSLGEDILNSQLHKYAGE